MYIITIVIFVGYALIVLFISHFINKRRAANQFDLIKYRDYLDQGLEMIDVTTSGATLMKDTCIVEYRRYESKGTLNEHVILGNHLPNKSHELILTYTDGELKVVRINGTGINPNLSPANYIAAHKILEMGQTAWYHHALPTT